MAIDEQDTRQAPPEAREASRDEPAPRKPAALIPQDSTASRALVTVIAIMTFLAAITAGAVQIIASASSEWRSAIGREVTIQVRPDATRDIEADVARAVALARDFPGVAGVRPFTRAESERLLEPWLGTGLQFDEIPVPRMIVVTLARGVRPDLTGLKKALADTIPGAGLDDHRIWVERLQAMAGTLVVAGVSVVVLVLAATALAVGFATQGAMAGNRGIVEILHYVGARDSFIVSQFARHFLQLGLQGGAFGGSAAIGCLWLAGFLARQLRATAGGDQIEAMFGTFTVGWAGYAAIVAIALAVAWLTAMVSSRTVAHQLGRMFR